MDINGYQWISMDITRVHKIYVLYNIYIYICISYDFVRHRRLMVSQDYVYDMM